jgi:uncharacterized membrane protein YtjA (UPF0391 family)
MLRWAFLFLLLGLSAGLLGYTEVADGLNGIELLFFLFLPIFFMMVVLALIVFLARGRRGTRAELQPRNLLLSSPRRRERFALNNKP